jgi:hypothetical protein
MLGSEGIVRPALDREIVGVVRSSLCAGRSVIELQERPCFTPPAELIDEGALFAIALEDLSCSAASR